MAHVFKVSFQLKRVEWGREWDNRGSVFWLNYGLGPSTGLIHVVNKGGGHLPLRRLRVKWRMRCRVIYGRSLGLQPPAGSKGGAPAPGEFMRNLIILT